MVKMELEERIRVTENVGVDRSRKIYVSASLGDFLE